MEKKDANFFTAQIRLWARIIDYKGTSTVKEYWFAFIFHVLIGILAFINIAISFLTLLLIDDWNIGDIARVAHYVFIVLAVIKLVYLAFSLIPWIALGLLGYLGIKMILEGVRKKKHPEEASADSGALTVSRIFLQGVATSIDALSVGLVIAEYSAAEAVIASVIIGITTFVLCLGSNLARKLLPNLTISLPLWEAAS